MWRWIQARRGRVLGYFWLCALGGSLLLSAHSAYRHVMQVEEYAFGCDSFGYLTMARAIRQAASRRELPQFHLESPQTRLLIDHMQASGLPLSSWDEMVAPHGHHYFPNSGHVGVQYPPGTALALAPFPEGRAVHGLGRVVICLFLGIGMLALFLAGARQAWASAGFVALAIHLGLGMLARIWDLSFSINAVLAPLMLSCLCLFAGIALSSRARNSRATWLLAFFAGGFLGFAILVRLPVVLLLPGFLLLLWPASWRWGIPPIVFGLGMILVGIVPLLVHQQRLTGAWYLPTYGPHDTAPPDLESLGTNLSYYFGTGHGSADNWALCVCAIGTAGLLLCRGQRNPAPTALGWQRLISSTLLLWTIPTAYFLTHRIITLYYSMPATLGAVVFLALGALTIESGAPAGEFPSRSLKRRSMAALAGALALGPGFVTIGRAATSIPRSLDVPEARAHQVSLPPDLAEDRAWIWADMVTGTLWYHAHKPTFKIGFGDPRARAGAYRLVHERGEPQYCVRDSDEMQRIMEEIHDLGGTVIPRGQVDGYPYYLIRWPEGGPRVRGQGIASRAVRHPQQSRSTVLSDESGVRRDKQCGVRELTSKRAVATLWPRRS